MNIQEGCHAIGSLLSNARMQQEAGAYAALADKLSLLQVAAREHFQATGGKQMASLIRKLEKNEPLTSDDRNMIRSWMVGDAEAYLHYENNFADWMQELGRLTEEISQLGRATLSTQETLQLQALCRDAVRTAWDIYHYLEHKERVDRFQEIEALKDADDRRTLINLLKRKMDSADT